MTVHDSVQSSSLFDISPRVRDILSTIPAGRHGGRWRHDQAALATHFLTRQAHLATLDLCALYVEQIVAIMTAVTHQLVAASDPVAETGDCAVTSTRS